VKCGGFKRDKFLIYVKIPFKVSFPTFIKTILFKKYGVIDWKISKGEEQYGSIKRNPINPHT